ncbi:MAG: vitamin K-dependent gamma-carboxylase [Verrucomicrobiota bacterium]
MPSAPASQAGYWQRFKDRLADPVSGASLAAFRFAVGLVMSLEAYALCRPNVAAISAGTTPLQTYYTGADITFHLPYPAFGWLPLLPPFWIHALVALLGLAGMTMAIGFCYRLSAITVFLTWGYLWVVESTRTYWQSHYYLEVLLTFLLIWMPAGRCYSIDAWLAAGRNFPRTIPFWPILILRGQLLLAYFYAGVAKFSADWVMDAAPMRWVLADPNIMAPYRSLLGSSQLAFVEGIIPSNGFAYFISWTGLLFDLAVGFLLLIRRTRVFALVLMIIFHATNHLLIFDDIGWFPLVGVTTALIFLNPDWPEKLGRWLRHPKVPKPDWGWFAAGAVLIPVVGAALGWKSKSSDTLPGEKKQRMPLGRWTAAFVAAWLVWQGVMPLRHYWIAGDGRFTYEGMSFSWRLKAEARHARGHQLFIRDTSILPSPGSGRDRIDWEAWHGERVLYRRLTPSRLDLAQLPEIVVVLEPLLGERIFFNAAGGPGIRNEQEARERISQLWQESYGRVPDLVLGANGLGQGLESVASQLAAAGRDAEAKRIGSLAAQLRQLDEMKPAEAMGVIREIRALIKEAATRPADAMMAGLRALPPFALEGVQASAGSLFYIEDRSLQEMQPAGPPRLNRKQWKESPSTRVIPRPGYPIRTAAPLVVYLGDLGITSRELLPQVCIFDSQDSPGLPPYIWWNSPRDLTISKGMHISNQAFFLRRYARRVADLWQKEYGRRPVVTAATAVSLNGRPPQMLVDPEADLASVSASWFTHNGWIKDLELRRIPREILADKNRRPAGFAERMP